MVTILHLESFDGIVFKRVNCVYIDVEKSQIQNLKAHLTNVMQQWCLPKLVCELHASLSERSSLTDAERSLLALIR